MVILPEMTSSKSVRASMLSTSFSLSRRNSQPEKRLRKIRRPPSTLDLLQHPQPQPEPQPQREQQKQQRRHHSRHRPPAPPTTVEAPRHSHASPSLAAPLVKATLPPQTQAPVSTPPSGEAQARAQAQAQSLAAPKTRHRPRDDGPTGREPVPPPAVCRRKSFYWKISSIIPSLISKPADTRLQSPAVRRTAANKLSQSDSPPPPPYTLLDSTTDLSQDGSASATDAGTRPASAQTPSSLAPELQNNRPKMTWLDESADPRDETALRSGSPSEPDAVPSSSLDQLSAPSTRSSRRDSPPENSINRRRDQMLSPPCPPLQYQHHQQLLQHQRRSSSPQWPRTADPQPGLRARATSPLPAPRDRTTSSTVNAADPSSSATHLAVPSTGRRTLSAKPGNQNPSRAKIRRSWLPGGGRSRSSSIDASNMSGAYAWILSDDGTRTEYNTTPLKNGEKVPELWNESGNVFVYLYPKGTASGPSLKVPEFAVSSSYVFSELMQSEFDTPTPAVSRSRSDAQVPEADYRISPPASPQTSFDSPGEMRLYLPAAPPTASGYLAAPGEASQPELDRLVAIRNLFAFLTGQPLVVTKSHPTIFRSFLQIADLLHEFRFFSIGGDSFGDIADISFDFYLEQHGLADCRHSRERTLEALILGERMRSLDLYNEAYAHAAGKYSSIINLGLPLFNEVSISTRERLERAHLDLVNRRQNVSEHLDQFEFPSLFSGLANSTSMPELRQVKFKVWRASFGRMRQFVLGHYKHQFGSWPPKASSKKNPFAEGGLNRLVLKVLYSDMCALYDLLVDRTNLTSRVIDQAPDLSDDGGNTMTLALRIIMSEFDRSRPPVPPPIPFDLPQLPSMTAIHENFNSLSTKEQSRLEKKVKENEMLLILNKAYNFDTNNIKIPFLDQFKEFERREARGRTCQELADQRVGYWLFLYVVLQSLPMLVVDAPGLKYTDGVEYFLCEPPMGNPPWVDDRQMPRKMWYEVAGGGGLVELSADAVMFSVEAIYHRSHCWLAAKQWEGADGAEAAPPEEPAMPPLEPPRPMFQGGDGLASSSPPSLAGMSTPSPPPAGSQSPSIRLRNLSAGANRASQAWRSSIALGLEPVPLEVPSPFDSFDRGGSLASRRQSSHMGSRSASMGNLAAFSASTTSVAHAPSAPLVGATFDDILGDIPKPAASKKKSRFF